MQSSAGCKHCWCRSCCALVSSSFTQRGLALEGSVCSFFFLLAHIPLTRFLALGIQVCRACALQKHSASFAALWLRLQPPTECHTPKKNTDNVLFLPGPCGSSQQEAAHCTASSPPPAAGIGAGARWAQTLALPHFAFLLLFICCFRRQMRANPPLGTSYCWCSCTKERNST